MNAEAPFEAALLDRSSCTGLGYNRVIITQGPLMGLEGTLSGPTGAKATVQLASAGTYLIIDWSSVRAAE